MSAEYERKRKLRLRKAGIRNFDKLIHDQDRAWLVENFGEGAPKYPVNVAKMIRNIIWQTRERVVSGDREKLAFLRRLASGTCCSPRGYVGF